METTGVEPRKHAIWQVAYIFEIDGKVELEASYQFSPHPKCHIDPKALEMSGLTEEEMRGQPKNYKGVYKQFVWDLSEFVQKFDKKDKFIFVGYNAHFDESFVRKWFEMNGDKYFGSFFWSGRIDILSMAMEHLQSERPTMPNFQLGSVGDKLGIKPNGDLHDALVDIRYTREVYHHIRANRNSSGNK